MSTEVTAVPRRTERAIAPAAAPPAWLARFDGKLEWLGEFLNPILVKECRQALKSRQFVVTFSLVLLFCWGWSMIGLAWLGPGAAYGAEGPEMFYFYFIILSFPLLVIVPFGAFRSLGGEREDRTFELLSITTLKPRQIVGGKLASAVVQMLVYLSAVAPCLAFTYILRGIDVLTIFFLLVYVCAASLAFTMTALLLATISRERHWQMVLSVLLIVGLCLGFFISCGLSQALLSWTAYFSFSEDPEFWIAHAACATAYVSYFIMFYLAAATQLTFASDNRSTPLRICVFVQQLLLTGWFAYMIWDMATQRQIGVIGEAMLVYLTMSAIHWFVMGSFMTGESPHLSPRVQRKLPKTFAGRTFLTWFNPGPGTGYMLALASFAGAAVMAVIAMVVWGEFRAAVTPPWRSPSADDVLLFSVMTLLYLALYLGLGKVLLMWIRKVSVVGVLTRVLVHALLVMAGTFIPLIIHLMSDFRSAGWSLMHITNPFWTLMELSERKLMPGATAQALMALSTATAGVLLLNLRGILEEVQFVRMAEPKRVVEEEAALHPTLTAPVRVPTNPWDEGS